ncbi:MAG: class I SAM-dependent methyltransferase [Acidimicrobiia bacterium]
MGLVRQLKSFRDRRLRIPVSTDALVLDVGGGDQPHWRADVVVDLYPESSLASQRIVGGGARVDRPLFMADVAALPFASGAFDYVVCSHTLEHVPDPAAAVAELCRVAPSGYIEVPDSGASKVLDFPSHLWWCSLEDGTLVFRAKRDRDFDGDIARFLAHPEVGKDVASLLARNFDQTVVCLRWDNVVDVRVEGEPDLSLMSVSDHMLPSPTTLTKLGRHLTAQIGSRLWSRRRRKRPLHFGHILPDDDFGPLDAEVAIGVHQARSGGEGSGAS